MSLSCYLTKNYLFGLKEILEITPFVALRLEVFTEEPLFPISILGVLLSKTIKSGKIQFLTD